MTRGAFSYSGCIAYLGAALIGGVLLSSEPATAQASTQISNATGAWKEKTQIVWSKETRTLVRKNFKVWDPHPELDLEFLWEPRTAVSLDQSDIYANGPGTLTWHKKGAASYDRRFTYSVFKGVLKNGRAGGLGVLAVRTGRNYTGQWLDGLM